jgi:hypothetical protein
VKPIHIDVAGHVVTVEGVVDELVATDAGRAERATVGFQTVDGVIHVQQADCDIGKVQGEIGGVQGQLDLKITQPDDLVADADGEVILAFHLGLGLRRMGERIWRVPEQASVIGGSGLVPAGHLAAPPAGVVGGHRQKMGVDLEEVGAAPAEMGREF